jgi:RHS repeat-associated protein
MTTNASGGCLQLHDYLPFGEDTINALGGRTGCYGTSDGVTEKFTGKERDAESGLDFFGARYMSAAQGRFTSPDPDNYDARLGVPQSWNMYNYTWNNPLKYTDNDGRAVNLVLAGVGAVAGFVANAGGYAVAQEMKGQSIDWSTALELGGVGAAAGSLAGLTFGASLVAQAGSAVLIGTGANVLNGIGSRAVTGQDILDESAVETDLETGAISSTIGAGVQFVGTVANLPVKPKLPSPLGTVQKQLQRLAKLRAWEQQREALGSRFSAFGSVVSSLISNAGVQINQAYNDAQTWGLSPSWQSFLTFGLWQQQTPVVTSKICYPNDEGGQTCQ